jgi:RNA polymerase sigma-70 factor (ECF subfamily)
MDRREDFQRLFERHQAEIRAFIGSLVRDPHVREDLFQEVALVLWKEWQRYDPRRSFGAWARGVTANKILQRREREGRRPVPFSPEAIQAVLDAYDRTEAPGDPRAGALERCLEGLPPKSRQLLALRYEQNLKLGEIAQRVGASLDAVHKALSRLRDRLQECVEQRLAAAEKVRRSP